jgi:hypothetical protein
MKQPIHNERTTAVRESVPPFSRSRLRAGRVGSNILSVGRPELPLRSPWLPPVAAASLVVPWTGLLAGLAWFLLLAARFDNRTGSCFTVAMLVVLVLATLAMLTGFPALHAG